MKISLLCNPFQIDNNKKINFFKVNSTSMQPHMNNSNITPLNSFNKYLINFTGSGLGNTLGKKAYKEAILVQEETIKHAKSNGIVGNLPFEWVQKIPKNERKTKIKEFYAAFKSAIKDFRENQNIQQTTEKLNNALHNAGIISPEENLTFKYLENSGNYGKGYHLEGIFDGNYMIKVFHKNDELNNDIHGNYSELARYAYWQKNAGKKTQKVRFYFGDIDAGYTVDRYIGENTPEYKGRIVPEEIYGLKNYDPVNKIKGYDIEVGGLGIPPEIEILSNNKTVRFVYGKLYKLPENKRMSKVYEFMGMKKYKNNKDIELGIAASINLLPETERLNYFNKLFKSADNKLKKVLAYRLDSLPVEERLNQFNKLLKDADNNIKEALAYRLDCIPDEMERLNAFYKLLNNADNEVKNMLARNLSYLPEKERFKCINSLLEDTNDNVKKTLVYKLDYLSDKDERLDIFYKLLKGSDNEVRKLLAWRIDRLHKDERFKCFNTLLENATNEIKEALSYNLSGLHNKNERIDMFYKLFANADNNIKQKLAENLCCLPKKSRVEAFYKLLENADSNIKEALADSLVYVPQPKRLDCYKKLIENTDHEFQEYASSFL